MVSLVSKILVFCVLTVHVLSCVETPDFPIEPRIEFVGLSGDTMQQGIFQEDSIFIVFRFEDGDGDIGRTDQEPDNNVFLIDDRTGTLDNTFAIPFIPQEGAGNGVEGEVSLLVYTTCCIYPDGQDPCTPHSSIPFDTVSYRIYIKDRAGHTSNEILTSHVILRCD